jgi:transposase
MKFENVVETKADLDNVTAGKYYVSDEDRFYVKIKNKWQATKPQGYYKQGADYKNHYFVIRNANLKLKTTATKIRADFFDEMCVFLNRCVDKVVDLHRTDWTDIEEYLKIISQRSFCENICKPISEKNGLGHTSFYSDLGFPSVTTSLKNGEKRVKTPEQQSIPKRGFIKSAAERVFSTMKRFKMRKGVVRTKKIKDVVRLHDTQVFIKNNKIFIEFNGQIFEYGIEIHRKNGKQNKSCSEVMKLLESKNSFGGNLKICGEDVILTQQLEIKRYWKYKPVGFIGFDLNKTENSFMCFSRSIKLFGKKTQVVSKSMLDSKILILEKQLSSLVAAKYGLRKKIINVHKKLSRLYNVFVLKLLNYIESEKLCLCIDHLKTGDKNGSFGQDKIFELLVSSCENRGIPFVIVPTPYTTRLCSACGYLNSKKELKIREFDCDGCKKSLVRDHNAARNIEMIGQKIWEQGMFPTQLEYYHEKGVNILKHK